VLSDTSAGPEAVSAVLDAVSDRPLTIVVDDAESLRDSPLEHALIGAKRDLVFIVSLTTEAVSSVFGGPYVEAKRARRGLVLSPSNAMTGTQAFATQIPKFMLGKTPAGGGVLFRDGSYTPVQVPDIRA
jgi:S-DNA-T family DNA segregation ATPase FtsK/SpoIIIE